jgi:hypothetical protein
MKKLTKDQAWEECIKMYSWIAENHQDFDDIPKAKAHYLKTQTTYAENTAPSGQQENGDLLHNCFFCEYAKKPNNYGAADCNKCPARLDDPKSSFHCANPSYNFAYCTEAFLVKLIEINAERQIQA